MGHYISSRPSLYVVESSVWKLVEGLAKQIIVDTISGAYSWQDSVPSSVLLNIVRQVQYLL
jgi:hypothetical protein